MRLMNAGWDTVAIAPLHVVQDHPEQTNEHPSGFRQTTRTRGQRCVSLRCVQRKLKAAVWRHVASPEGCSGPSLVKDVKSIRRLGERLAGVVVLVRLKIPHDLCCCARDDSVCRTHRVRITVVAYGRDSQMCGARDDIGEIPAKGDGLVGGDFVEGGCRLLGLSNGEGACWCSLWNKHQTET